MAVNSLMKSGGIAALAFGLAMSLPAAASAQGIFAQPTHDAQPRAEARHDGNGGGGERSGRRDNPQAGGRQGGQQNAQQNGQRPAWVGQNRGGDQRNAQNVQRNWNGNANRGGDRGEVNRWQGNNQARGDNNRWQGNRNNNGARWNNNWRGDNRYNWSGYRNSNRDVFRAGRYSAPYRNWSYHRIGIGFRLQPLFYSNSYWINDPGYYRLPEAYGPYRWVRYYDDALLVDIYSGQVVDVINDFFW